jgi:hypothetical protein
MMQRISKEKGKSCLRKSMYKKIKTFKITFSQTQPRNNLILFADGKFYSR